MSEPGQLADAEFTRSALSAAQTWLERDGKVALATVVGTWGSAPVPVGGQMVIAQDGSFHGSVSGGCVEGEVIAEAEDVLANGTSETLTFGVADETAWGVGLPCGGEIKVYIERVSADDDGRAMIDRAVTAQETRDGLVIATNLTTGKKTLFKREDTGLDADIVRRFSSGKSQVVETADGPVFYQAILPPARTIVIGATHIAQLFAQMGHMAGYEVIVVDPRTAFASADRFPDVTLHAEWPQDILPKLGLDPYTAVVVVAHVSHIDDEALKTALRSDCLYIGALGSRRNHAKRTERLKDAGFNEDEIGRIKCPIGLDIGAQSPAEIAIAIMSEVVLAVRGPKQVAVAA
ncbi:MAG: XdhC family protein [Pseudomonadota bacterium]